MDGSRIALFGVLLLLSFRGCGGAQRPADPAEPAARSARRISEPAAADGSQGETTTTTVKRPDGRLTVPEARRYMLELINRDRKANGLRPVALDEGAPTAAGQAHAEDMAKLGYLGHWGSDGSVPEQRHTEAGGADMVLENALCFTDEQKRTLDPSPTIDPAQIERAESLFFDEVPPNDGHRKNILKPTHTAVGIGVAQPKDTAKEIAVPCFSQEFVDGYGTYEPLPRTAKVGAVVHVAGALGKGARPTGIGVARVALPTPLPAAELNTRRTYPVPKPYQVYWGPGFVTPIKVKIDGSRFSIDVPLDDKKAPGLYEVSVWGKLAGSSEQTMLSLRTIVVR